MARSIASRERCTSSRNSGGRHLLDRAVVVALARDFVPAPGDLAQHLGHLVCHPAEGEEGRLDAELVEQIERAQRVALDPLLEAIPLRACDQFAKRDGLKVVLDGDRQQMPLWCRRVVHLHHGQSVPAASDASLEAKPPLGEIVATTPASAMSQPVTQVLAMRCTSENRT